MALNDVSMDVRKGEIFGILGRNGAGKSTLLKVVSRVLIPTQGRVWVNGMVSPLLELGGGFHPELTGAENIFLNATLLGHSRKEIQKKIPEILDFAEIGEFLNLFSAMTKQCGIEKNIFYPGQFGVETASSSSKGETIPLTQTRPWVGIKTRETTFNSVDFPAPFRPRIPNISPFFTSRLTSLKAIKE